MINIDLEYLFSTGKYIFVRNLVDAFQGLAHKTQQNNKTNKLLTVVPCGTMKC